VVKTKTRLSAVDREALERALERARALEQERNDPRRDGKTQLESMLEDRPWQKVAEFAAYGQQMRSLGLRPWEWPPCWVHTDDANPEHGEAVKLLKRLLDAGLSRFEPDPIKALRGAEPPRAA
jgi:hypothetical protein